MGYRRKSNISQLYPKILYSTRVLIPTIKSKFVNVLKTLTRKIMYNVRIIFKSYIHIIRGRKQNGKII